MWEADGNPADSVSINSELFICLEMMTLGLEMVLLTSSMGQWQTLLCQMLFGCTYFTGIVQYIIEEKTAEFSDTTYMFCV